MLLTLPKLLSLLLLLSTLLALALAAPRFDNKKYSKAARRGGRFGNKRLLGNLINVDPWAFPNQFPYPSIPVNSRVNF